MGIDIKLAPFGRLPILHASSRSRLRRLDEAKKGRLAPRRLAVSRNRGVDRSKQNCLGVIPRPRALHRNLYEAQGARTHSMQEERGMFCTENYKSGRWPQACDEMDRLMIPTNFIPIQNVAYITLSSPICHVIITIQIRSGDRYAYQVKGMLSTRKS
jgi:hypothetical protein